MEQRVEPAKKAAQLVHKKLQGCMQSQPGLEAEKRMVCKRDEPDQTLEACASCLTRTLSPQKKLPLMLLSISMAESLKDFDAESSIRYLAATLTCVMWRPCDFCAVVFSSDSAVMLHPLIHCGELHVKGSASGFL